MTPLIIFDLDGTLADSKKDLCASVNYVRESFGMDRIEMFVSLSMRISFGSKQGRWERDPELSGEPDLSHSLIENLFK